MARLLKETLLLCANECLESCFVLVRCLGKVNDFRSASIRIRVKTKGISIGQSCLMRVQLIFLRFEYFWLSILCIIYISWTSWICLQHSSGLILKKLFWSVKPTLLTIENLSNLLRLITVYEISLQMIHFGWRKWLAKLSTFKFYYNDLRAAQTWYTCMELTLIESIELLVL